METSVHIKTDFASVFLLNGTFTESADRFSYGTHEPLYITVLPLSAHLLPYTVKIAANKPLSNENLCAVFTVESRLYLKLFPRYNYIYTPVKKEDAATVRLAERLFHAVKQKNYAAARKLLSQTLTESIDDDGLYAFFNDYTAIVKDDFSKVSNPDAYYLIGADGVGSLFYFETAEGLIDNIVEETKN